MDPKFELIKKNLEESTIDDQEFERVAAEMQDGNGWNSFWIAGGGDFGEDGVLIDKHANSIPLITTTSDRALENIKRNLKKLLDSGWKGKKVAFATPRKLTTAKRKNIKDHLDSLKIQSVGMFDSVWYAERLLKFPHFCKSLLGITLDYPALSPIPLNPRFSLVPGTIGRADEKKRVFEIFKEKKDFLVSGQPGSGKTHLLRELAKIGEAYFVVTSDQDAIANEIRHKNPKYILLDDVHSKIELLEKLLLFRKEIGADFSLGIDTWPSSRDEIIQLLSLSDDQIIDLGPLKRDDIVTLIKAEGILSPSFVIRSIVDQSRGKPGLASFLCQQFKAGAANEVVFGHSLLTRLRADNRKQEGIIPLLSVISLGGDQGVDLEKVGKALGKAPFDLVSQLSALAVAGVIEESKKQRIAVQPNLLRHNLIKEKFFNSNPLLPKNLLLNVSEDREVSIGEIIQAVRVGASIAADELYELIKETDKEDNWKSFSWLGKEFVTLALKNNPELLLVIGEAALVHTPELTLPMLFDEAAKNEYSTHVKPPAYKIISDWLTELPAYSKQDVVERRECFINEAKRWLHKGGKHEVIKNLLSHVLSVYWDSTEVDPGQGNKFTISNGIMPMAVINKIPSLMKNLIELYIEGQITDPSYLLDAVLELSSSRAGMLQISEDLQLTIREYRDKCLQMLLPVVASYQDEGFRHRLIERLNRSKISHNLTLSKDFNTLFPAGDLEEDYEVTEAKAREEVNELVQNWLVRKHRDAAFQLASIVRSAKKSNLNWPDRSSFFTYELARAVVNPLEWAQALKEFDLEPRYMDAFLGRVINERMHGWEDFVEECIGLKSSYRILAILKLIVTSSVPKKLWDLVENNLKLEDSHWLSQPYSFINTPEENAKRLLVHPLKQIRGAFAISQWDRKEKRSVLTSLKDIWEDALLEFTGDRYTIKEILKTDHSFAAKWILKNLKGDWVKFEVEDIIKASVKHFSVETRRDIILQVPFTVKNKNIIKVLIDRNLELYKILINSGADPYIKAAPLEGYLSTEWEEMAIWALDSGIDEEEVLHGTMIKSYGFSGSRVNYWEQRKNNHSKFVNASDWRISKIARNLEAYAQREIEAAKNELRDEEIYGR